MLLTEYGVFGTFIENGTPHAPTNCLPEGKNSTVLSPEHRTTPVNWKARVADIRCLEEVLKRKPDLRVVDKYGKAPLHYAAVRGNKKCLKRLLAHSAGVHARTRIYKHGSRYIDALIEASERIEDSSSHETKHFDGLNAIDMKGNTPLHLAVIAGNVTTVGVFIADPYVDINAINKDGDNPLHLAVKKKDKWKVKVLLNDKRRKLNINTTNKEGKTPSHLAVMYDQYVILEMFLNYPGVNSGIKDADGNTLLTLLEKKHKTSKDPEIQGTCRIVMDRLQATRQGKHRVSDACRGALDRRALTGEPEWASASRTQDASRPNFSRVMRKNFGVTTAEIVREHSDSLERDNRLSPQEAWSQPAAVTSYGDFFSQAPVVSATPCSCLRCQTWCPRPNNS